AYHQEHQIEQRFGRQDAQGLGNLFDVHAAAGAGDEVASGSDISIDFQAIAGRSDDAAIGDKGDAYRNDIGLVIASASVARIQDGAVSGGEFCVGLKRLDGIDVQ